MQLSVMQQRAFTRTAILAVLVALATTQQCDYQVTVKSVINVPASEKNGVVFMSDVYKSSREECQGACCDMEEEELDDGSYVKCNLAVFHHAGKPHKANCFLIYCPFEGSCVFSELGGFSSSFVTYTLKPTEAAVANKPPRLKFTNPTASPIILHKLVRRSNGQDKSPTADATDAEKAAKEVAGSEIAQVQEALAKMVKQQIKKVESNMEAAGTKAEVHEATPKSPEPISTTTVLVDGGKSKTNQKGAVVTTVSTTKVNGDPTPKPTQAKAEPDVKKTTESTEVQGSTGGPPAATQPIIKQAPHQTPSPPKDSPTPQPLTSVKPTVPSLPTNSPPPGSETHLTSKSTSGSEVKVEPSSSKTTHRPSAESSGSNASQPTTVQQVSPDSPPITQALKPSIKPTGSSSLSVSDSISNATHNSTSLEAPSSSALTSPSSSSNSPTTQSSFTTTPPTHPAIPLNVTESSLQTTMSNVSNSTLPIAPSSAPSTPPSKAPSTAPSTQTSLTTLLHLTSNQSHNTSDDSLITIKVTESTQSSTLYSDDDVNSTTIPSNSTPSIPPTVQEPAKTVSSSVDDPFRKEMDDNETLAGNPTSLPGNETSASLDNETIGVEVGNETAAAAIDTDEGEEDTTANSLIASNGALIAAVCFGVLFLMAVLVVIGKHWYEAYQRRHYSKVDYLINGMYN